MDGFLAEAGRSAFHFVDHGFSDGVDDFMITLKNLTLGYQRHPAIHHLEVSINLGAMVAVVGPNGAGKSTLLKGMMGQLKPLEGHILFEEISASDIAYLPQKSKIDDQFPITVWEMAAMGLWRKTGILGKLSDQDRQRIEEALHQVGLSGFENRQIGTLSGGQLQRLLFARLLLQDAKLLLLDEPFNALDRSTENDLLDLLTHWNRQGKTIITVWHDIEGVRQHFPQTLLLARNLIAFGQTSLVLTEDNLEKAKNRQVAFRDDAKICATGDHV